MRGQLLFTGTMSYEPNATGIIWFVKNGFPIILKKFPIVSINVVGTDPIPEVKELNSQNVHIRGRVPDVRPYFESAEIYIAPILTGGGTRLKILEAAACGKAIVSTTLGAEGIDLKADEEIIIADSTKDFAEAICGLLEITEKRKKLELKVRQPIIKYDWKTVTRKAATLINDIKRRHQ